MITDAAITCATPFPYIHYTYVRIHGHVARLQPGRPPPRPTKNRAPGKGPPTHHAAKCQPPTLPRPSTHDLSLLYISRGLHGHTHSRSHSLERERIKTLLRPFDPATSFLSPRSPLSLSLSSSSPAESAISPPPEYVRPSRYGHGQWRHRLLHVRRRGVPGQALPLRPLPPPLPALVRTPPYLPR